ncbi:uncharacterized protein LOC111518814 [Drosophila willistoni]|uniref:uncharacterized protein LOC111518814 n=1 Tax=Drosophila willistoni TaxID=7260 RepID=UPI001F0812B7|nr:uncharacterized protein LOC111518814 [Drosophila willistoni]
MEELNFRPFKMEVNKKECNTRQNYYVENDVCYTEDHLVVHELYINYMPAQVMEEDLSTYFNGYGEVKSLRVNSFPISDTLEARKTGCVFFVKALDAAKVLRSGIHEVNGHRIYIEASHSWRQPDAFIPLEIEQSHLMKIPDDCLIQILEYLQLNDQVHFLRYCSRFRELDTGTLHKSIKFEISLSEWDIRDLFFICGRSIQSIEYDDCSQKLPFERFLNYFEKNCINLNSLKLKQANLCHQNVFKILASNENLEDLEFIDCSLNNNILEALKNLRNLKRLYIFYSLQYDQYENRCLFPIDQVRVTTFKLIAQLNRLKRVKNPELTTVSDLKLPESIETLTIIGCKGISPNHLIQICKSLPNLRELDLRNFSDVPSDIYDYLNSLETFTFDIAEPDQYQKIAKLPKLKTIQFELVRPYNLYIANKYFNLLGELVNQIVAIKSQQLEHLKIDFRMNETILLRIANLRGLRELFVKPAEQAMTDAVLREFSNLKNLESLATISYNDIKVTGVFRLIIGCPKLRHLKLSNCKDMTENLTHGISDIVRYEIVHKENQRELPIYLYVRESEIRFSLNGISNNIIKIVIDKY